MSRELSPQAQAMIDRAVANGGTAEVIGDAVRVTTAQGMAITFVIDWPVVVR